MILTKVISAVHLKVLGRGEHEDHAVFEKGVDVDHGGLETGQAVSMWVGLEGLLQLLDLHHINSSANLGRGRRHLGEIEDDVSRSDSATPVPGQRDCVLKGRHTAEEQDGA